VAAFERDLTAERTRWPVVAGFASLSLQVAAPCRWLRLGIARTRLRTFHVGRCPRSLSRGSPSSPHLFLEQSSQLHFSSSSVLGGTNETTMKTIPQVRLLFSALLNLAGCTCPKRVNKAAALLALACALCANGCGTTTARQFKGNMAFFPKCYPATSFDASFISTPFHGSGHSFGTTLGCCAFGVADLPISIVTDTVLLPYDILRRTSVTPRRVNSATEELAKAKTDQERFYALGDAAKGSFLAGKMEDARSYASNLLALLPKFPNDWNYGNAVQNANLVLGRIAVQEGRMDDAKHHLLEAGKSPGSPVMNSSGPNMSLAQDLLEKGERDVVLEYFELCRKFWQMDRGRLDQWGQDVKAGKTPDFGANLVY